MIFYTVYRTQNIVNGKYYFGVHKTKNPYDGYLGSGKVLKAAIAKYGEQSFIKNVCFIYDNPEEAFAKEFELIETYRADPLCYNLRQGGSGGFDWINQNVPPIWRRTLGVSTLDKLKRNPAMVKIVAAGLKRGRKLGNSHPLAINNNIELLLLGSKLGTEKWRGQTHSQESKQKMRESQAGNRNPMFGMRWVFRGEEEIRVPVEDYTQYISLGWLSGRVKKRGVQTG